MMKERILGVLFFSALWGASEAGLGGLLYGAGLPHSSIVLTLVALAILTVSRRYVPQRGFATLIGLCAMLFKFLNAPFFACHFAGIAMTGLAFDIAFAFVAIDDGARRHAVAAFAAALGSYALFAISMTFIIKYRFWTGSMDKLWNHIAEGAVTAAGCAIAVPLVSAAARRLEARFPRPFELRLDPISLPVGLATAGLWAMSLVFFSQTMIAG
jgi:hypothetical protein